MHGYAFHQDLNAYLSYLKLADLSRSKRSGCLTTFDAQKLKYRLPV
jgi:hypothetical protein